MGGVYVRIRIDNVCKKFRILVGRRVKRMELYSLGNHIVGRSYVFGVLKSFWEMLIFVGCIRMDIGDLRGLSDD